MLVKHADGFVGPDRGPQHMSPGARRIALRAVAGLVDPYFSRALDRRIGCWIVPGQPPYRVARLIETGAVR
jgi:hypothetical protein